MPTTIEIDDQVFAALQARAKPFVDTPNSVLRRLLELSGSDGECEPKGAHDEGVKLSKGPEKRYSGEPAPRHVEPQPNRQRYTRASRHGLLPQSVYYDPILEILHGFGGEHSSRGVIDKLPEKIGHLFKPKDLEPTRRGDVRWRNRAQWARNTLMEDGLLERNSPWGIWRLTDEGGRRAQELVDGNG